MENIIDEDYKIVFSEVYDILSFLEQDELNKISPNFINFIKLNKSKTYITNISPYLPLEMQNLKEETKDIIAFIYRKYMCTEEEKLEFNKKDKQEWQQIEAKKRELYNPDNLFKNKTKVNSLPNNNRNANVQGNITNSANSNVQEDITNNTNMLIIKENFVHKIISKIKVFINKLLKKSY